MSANLSFTEKLALKAKVNKLISDFKFTKAWLDKLAGNKYSKSAICYLDKKLNRLQDSLEELGCQVNWSEDNKATIELPWEGK